MLLSGKYLKEIREYTEKNTNENTQPMYLKDLLGHIDQAEKHYLAAVNGRRDFRESFGLERDKLKSAVQTIKMLEEYHQGGHSVAGKIIRDFLTNLPS